ncbi:glycosyltransferase family 2 protein [Tolypothrix sp. FACHB-123]|uniref:glycosyltransferase n=1 Tax=Tolypothrix sp. FACHB-123 TaxID=2692868 RepID=UPI0016891A7E|nr:glycosyltransferase [Tolypothrix sp. FACHB-123]MBD2358443.1 glycosyltransferase family 2 protein [Tolypothrix sp. FACHB-123]
MKLIISVIICTYNPRRDYLDKVLAALKSQTLSLEQWELLFIDNASDQFLSSEIDITWHPNAYHIREEQLGLTPARLRGIKEAKTEILIFVDDDNVLNSDYLEVALQISKDYPFIGAWGGQIRPNFEIEPPEWTKPYWPMLVIREFERDKWSNLLHQHETTPCGAGLCIRKFVAEKYAESLSIQTERIKLDRQGKQLTSGGDSDLAFTACDMGLGTGQFTALKMTHLIPAFRLQLDYLERLAEGMTYSHTIVNSIRGQIPKKPSWRKKLFQYYIRWRLTPNQRRLHDASIRGLDMALKSLTS